MTQRSITYLKAKFETKDIPTQTDYQDVFDSFLSLESSATQTLNGPLIVPSMNMSSVSAASVTANTIQAGTVSANTINVTTISAANANFTGTVTANNINILGTTSAQNIYAGTIFTERLVAASAVSANVIHVDNAIYNSHAHVNPLGTVVGSAASLMKDVSHVLCTAATERAIKLTEMHLGRTQYIYNDSASVTAVTIFPFTGKNFVGTAADSGMLIAAGQTMQVIHMDTSVYTFVRY